MESEMEPLEGKGSSDTPPIVATESNHLDLLGEGDQAQQRDVKILNTEPVPWDIIDLLRVLPDHKAPMIAFCRASRAQPHWRHDGELRLDDSGACFVPASIISRFKNIDDHGRDSEQLLSLATDEFLKLETCGNTSYVSTVGSVPISTERQQDSDLLLERRFDFLSIMLRAQPEAYSSIEWEEVSSQLRGTVELSCLPLLRVINFDDVRKYVALSHQKQTNEDPALSQYLTMLLRFLSHHVGRYPFLRYLMIEILDHCDKVESSHRLLSEVVHTRKILEMHISAQNPDSASNFWPVFLEQLHQNGEPLTKRLNATIGIHLGELIRTSTATDPLRMTRGSWRPMQQEIPSPLERIAIIYLGLTPSLPETVLRGLTLETQTLISFILSKRKLYNSAKRILNELLPALQFQYGQNSMPFGLAVSEFVKCCNMTEDVATGTHWAQLALSKRLEAHTVKTSADTLYLRVALADSFLAASEYESAIELLSDILQNTQPDQPSIVAMLIVRLSKAHRRLGEPFPSPNISNALARGIKALGQVSKSLRLAFIEEIGCNIDSMDVSDVQCRKLHESLEKIVSRPPSLPNEQEVADLEKELQKLSVFTSSDMTSSEETIAVDQPAAISNQTDPPTSHAFSQALPSVNSEPSFTSVATVDGKKSEALVNTTDSTSKLHLTTSKSKQIFTNLASRLSELTTAMQAGPRLSTSTEMSSLLSRSTVATTLSDDWEELAASLPSFGSARNTQRPLQAPPTAGSTFGSFSNSPSSHRKDGKHAHKSSGGHSSSKRAPSPPAASSSSEQEYSKPETEDAPIQVTPSFLFSVNRQELNEDPDKGGIPTNQQIDPNTLLWSPPVYAAGFGQQSTGTVYRWHDGQVSRATGVSNGAAGLTQFKAVTMFWCNPFNQFVVTEGNVRFRDLPGSPAPQDRWYPLCFHHLDTVSYLDFAGKYTYLAGNRAGFIRRLGLESYQNQEDNAPRAGGLAGNLAMLIGLIAFSCRTGDLDRVLIDDKAWRYQEWRGHDRRHGRRDARGLFVTVYLDPRNPDGSTAPVLGQIEWHKGALLS